MHFERKHIAAIAPTVDEARDLASQFHIPRRNAISEASVDRCRGREFAGYIIQPGYLPPDSFWRTFLPSLMGAPTYSVDELHAMLAEAGKHEAEHGGPGRCCCGRVIPCRHCGP